MKALNMHVILVNDQNEEIGILDKITAHNEATPLHRGFSVFVFDDQNQILIQKRSIYKKTWPSFWSNSFCGHPQQGETDTDAIMRHAGHELNISKLDNIQLICNYAYRFSYNNIVENEICPVYIARSTDKIIPNPNEVEDFRWLPWDTFMSYIVESDDVNIMEPRASLASIRKAKRETLSNVRSQIVENNEFNFTPWCIQEAKFIKEKISHEKI